MQVRLALAAAVLAGCGAPGQPRYVLEGSVSTVVPLGYDAVKLLVAPQDTSVVFLRNRPQVVTDAGATAANEDIVLKVAVKLWGEPYLARNVTYDLAERDENNVQRGTVGRNVFNDTRTTFPELRLGRLKCDKDVVVESSLGCSLNLTFENGTDTASGRTVFGSFRARVYQ